MESPALGGAGLELMVAGQATEKSRETKQGRHRPKHLPGLTNHQTKEAPDKHHNVRTQRTKARKDLTHE